MSQWNKMAGNGALYGLHEMGKKKRRKSRIKRSKADASGPGVVKKKHNPRPKKAEVRTIDPTGYVPQEKIKRTPGGLFEAQLAMPVATPPRRNNNSGGK